MLGRRLVGLLGTAAVLVGLASPVAAGDSYCVSCSGPQASYLCEVTIPDGVVPSQSPQLYCAYRLAGDGHHASCASRRADASACAGGLPRKLAYQGPSLTTTGTVDAPANAVEPPAVPDAAAPLPAPEDTTTVIEPSATASEDAAPSPDAASAEAAVEEGDPKDSSRVTDAPDANAVVATADAERSTGDKIAGAAKTAFNCLASFFKECKE